jgi:hypothetical protein
MKKKPRNRLAPMRGGILEAHPNPTRTSQPPQTRPTLRARLDALVVKYAELVTALIRTVIP